jgi:1-acyl-sn-glycerol-3-phosphate acyltransferase
MDMVDERRPIVLDIFRLIMGLKLKKNIHQMYVYGLANTQHLVNDTGAIIAPNHQSYWDSALFFYLSELLGKRAFVFMAEENLDNLAFFRWCGAIPLKIQSPSIAMAQLRTAFKIATEPTQFWIFPQGLHRPPHLRPLKFKKGVTTLASSTDYPIVPTAIQYLYQDDEQPNVYIHFGSPLSPHASPIDIEEAVSLGLEDIDSFYQNADSVEFTPLFKRPAPRRSWFTRALSRFAQWSFGEPNES